MKTLTLLALVLTVGGCAPEAGDAAPDLDVSAASPVPNSAATADRDPCSLVAVDEWLARTEYTDIVADRNGRDSCDFLSDDFYGVVGSVSIYDRAFMEYTAGRSDESAPVPGLGDEAFTIPLGVLFRVDEQVVFVMVNPGIDDHARVALELARIAHGRL
jgi:hypothetical protein